MKAYYVVALILAIIAGVWAVLDRAWWGVLMALSAVFICVGLLKLF